MGILSDMIRENQFTPEDLPQFERKLFFSGPKRRSYLERYGVLLFLAAVIATTGVIADSTATVIGAMIIAPLMTPIIATTAALVVGRMARAFQSTLIVAAGVAGVIALSWLLGTVYLIAGGFISFGTSAQIAARTSPDLIDLVAALASGAAGAFAMSRDDIADSLPGVAISISLVPPLCVVGVAASYGEWAAAGGALLLFLTNYLSILLAGGGVLALLGLSRAATADISKTARRNAFVVIGLGVLIITIPLAFTYYRITTEAWVQRKTRAVVETWVDETGFEVRDIKIDFLSERIEVTITGPGESPPSFPELITELETNLRAPVQVRLEIISSQALAYPQPVSEAPE